MKRYAAILAFTFVVAATSWSQPNISGITPNPAAAGAAITIAGTGFGSQQGSSVSVNGILAPVTSWTATSIGVTLPLSATTGPVVVSVTGVASNAASLTISPTPLPQVVQVQPANSATAVPRNRRIILRFAQAVPAASLASTTVSVLQGATVLNGTVMLSNDLLSATFVPAQTLAASTAFSVVVKDVANGQTTPMFQSSFTTGTGTESTTPQLVQSSPQNGDADIPVNAPIVVQFSKAMDPATLTPATFGVIDPTTGQPISGVVQVDATGLTASFVPQPNMGVHRTFNVTLGQGILDSSGHSIQSGTTTFGFTTSFLSDTQGPVVIGSSPQNTSTGIPLNARVVVRIDKPVSVLSLANGFQVKQGATVVGGGTALSDGNKLITFTPQVHFAATTTYTISLTSSLASVSGLALTNPGTFTFTTGSANDTTTATVDNVTPASQAEGVPTNAVVSVHFSKQVDPLTITNSTFTLLGNNQFPVAGTVVAAGDGRSASFTPTAPLQSGVLHLAVLSNGVVDMEGQAISQYQWSFLTGSGPGGGGVTVSSVSPVNGSTGVPVSTRVSTVLSGAISKASVTATSFNVSVGGNPVAGTFSFNDAGTVATFTPTSSLPLNSTVSINVSGVSDVTGSAVTAFTSSFTTLNSSVRDTTVPTVSSVSPANSASNVAVTTPIALTFSEPIDFSSVNNSTLQISVSGFYGVLAGSYSVNSAGTMVTFTPATQLPGNALVVVNVSGVADRSGNLSSSFGSTFTTASTSDSTVPTVLGVTPSDGASTIGLAAPVVLTFSKSLNSNTINTNNFGLLANGAWLGIGLTYSVDNRVVTLRPGALPPSTVITVVVTSDVTDLSGNQLAEFVSDFTTGSSSILNPSVVSQRPSNGAQNVALNSTVVLYLSDPMDSSSVQNALHLVQNGVVVAGTTSVTSNGQVVQFSPSSAWAPNTQVQVFLDSTAASTDGRALSNYQASFTTSDNSASVAPVVVSFSPEFGVTNVPTNGVVDFEFNEALDPTTLTASSVQCFENNTWIQTASSLTNSNKNIHIIPRALFHPNTVETCKFDTALRAVNGVATTGMGLPFTTGSTTDATLPAIVSISPPNNSTNVGDNAQIRLVFSKPIAPPTINSTTIQIGYGTTTVVTDSISLSSDNLSAILVPHAPLPDATQISIVVNGVTDIAGHAVASQTTHFTTGSGPDVTAAFAIAESPFQSATNVPLNAVISVQANEPIDGGSLSPSSFLITSSVDAQSPSGTYSLSSDGRTINFVANPPLTASSTYTVNFAGRGTTDIAGNLLTCATNNMCDFSFTTGATADSTGPQVVAVSPGNNLTGTPINTQVVISFNEPVDSAGLAQIQLLQGATNIPVAKSAGNGNRTITLGPLAALSQNTSYTVSVAGVSDLSGNLQTSSFSSSFTTGTKADLTAPQVTTFSPVAGATGTALNSSIVVQFSEPIDPITVDASTFQVTANISNVPVVGSVVVAGDRLSATFTPSAPLNPQTFYTVAVSNGVLDLAGEALGSGSSYFTTGTGTLGGSPVIYSLSATATQPSTSITVNGSYFGTTKGTSTVKINGVTATTTSWSSTQIVATVPAAATTGAVIVTVNSVASNGKTLVVLYTPTITSISPTAAPPGASITLHGTHFGSTFDTPYVIFQENIYPVENITPTSWTQTSMVVTVPAHAITGNVFVVTGGMPSAGFNYTVQTKPQITSVDPASGVSGTTVNVYGSGFGASQGTSTLKFNGVNVTTINSWTDGFIAGVLPTNVTTGPVTVTVSPLTSNNNVIYTVALPTISALAPATAAVGATITLNGSLLTSNGLTTQVFFNSLPVTPNQSSATSLTVTVPTGATTGPVTVKVGTKTSNALTFSVEQPPAVSGISPNHGYIGSWPITITGSGFGSAKSSNTVTFFGDIPAPIISWTDTEIQAVVPDGASTGPITVTVGGLTVDSEWFYLNAIVQLTDSLGNQSSYTSAVTGGDWVLSNSQGPGCSTCTIRGDSQTTADASGNLLTITDALGHTATYTYDGNSNLASESRPLDGSTTATTSYTYNSLGEPLTVTDPLGHTTTNTYDAKGNLLTVTSPAPNGTTAASVTQFAYDTKGELTTITDPLTRVTTLAYNTAGLISSITDAQQHVTSYGYDARGNRTSVTDALNHTTSFAFDAMNRLTTITYPGGSTVGFTYDSRGRRTSVTDQNSKTTTYTYDDADRLITVTDAASNSTHYAYDTENNLTGITDANGHTTSFEYNARGWVTQTNFPSSLAETYVYDAIGNLTSKTDRKSQTIQYVYDALNRMTHKGYPDSTGVDYVYDLVGKIQQVTDPTGVYGFAYDNMGRLIGTSTDYAFDSAGAYTNSYAYDAASNRTGFTAPDGSTNTYGYDTLNRLSSLTNSLTGQFGFSYDALSRRTQLTRPNGVNTNYSYDSLSRLLSVLHQTGSTTLDGASYVYDNAGNRTSKTNYLNNITEGYTYDPLYQLTQVTQGASTTETYSYDDVGNRLSSLGVPSYSYNASNELTSNSVGSFAYDNDGNTVADASGKTYAWDYENRLTSAVVPAVGNVLFKYDPFGRRIQKNAPSGIVNFVYDGRDVALETDSSSSSISRYTRGRSIDEPLAEIRSGAINYFHADGLRSITSLTDLSSVVSAAYNYSSFGKLSSSTGSVTNSFLYTGRESDTETGLYYYRARYYNPDEGRFLNDDPAHSGLNFYAYVHNSPVDRVDPLGLWDTATHSALYWNALRACLSKEDIWILQQSSSNLDADTQMPWDAYIHSMGAPGQTSAAAEAASDNWINTNIASARDNYQAGNSYWLLYFANALHTLTDSTSPQHTNSDGLPITWPSFPNAFHHGHSPYSGEEWSNMTPDLMNFNIQMIRLEYEAITGKKCACGDSN